jgi:hypothetical protein
MDAVEAVAMDRCFCWQSIFYLFDLFRKANSFLLELLVILFDCLTFELRLTGVRSGAPVANFVWQLDGLINSMD